MKTSGHRDWKPDCCPSDPGTRPVSDLSSFEDGFARWRSGGHATRRKVCCDRRTFCTQRVPFCCSVVKVLTAASDQLAFTEGRCSRQPAPSRTRPRNPESRGLRPADGQSAVNVGRVTRPLAPKTELAGFLFPCRTVVSDGLHWTTRLGGRVNACESPSPRWIAGLCSDSGGIVRR
jgi:hypothetical protein